MSRELGPSDISAYFAIRAPRLRLGIDVIHGHGAKGGAYSRLVARALKRSGSDVASCYTPHGGSLHYSPTSVGGRIYMQLERQLAGATDALRVRERVFGRALCRPGRAAVVRRSRHSQWAGPADFGAPADAARTPPISCSWASCGASRASMCC